MKWLDELIEKKLTEKIDPFLKSMNEQMKIKTDSSAAWQRDYTDRHNQLVKYLEDSFRKIQDTPVQEQPDLKRIADALERKYPKQEPACGAV